MRILKPGDPCPSCRQSLRQADPDTLRLLAAIADIAGFNGFLGIRSAWLKAGSGRNKDGTPVLPKRKEETKSA